jgi:4-hydroxy-4-methyl-2-oxoglutarate aldolase
MAEFMDLAQLAAARTPDPTSPLDIDAGELCDRYARTYTGAISDVLREFNLMDQTLPIALRPLRPEMVLAGFAFTILSSRDPSVDLDGEMKQRADLLEAIPAHAVCVWDTNHDDGAAHWGGMMTAAVKKRSVRGAIVDGGIRDTHQIAAENFPIFYRFHSSSGMLGRAKVVAHQVPISLGQTLVFPGDMVVADVDGAIVVPRRLACDVVRRTEAVMGFEDKIKSWVDAGNSPSEIVEKGGYF